MECETAATVIVEVAQVGDARAERGTSPDHVLREIQQFADIRTDGRVADLSIIKICDSEFTHTRVEGLAGHPISGEVLVERG